VTAVTSTALVLGLRISALAGCYRLIVSTLLRTGDVTRVSFCLKLRQLFTVKLMRREVLLSCRVLLLLINQ